MAPFDCLSETGSHADARKIAMKQRSDLRKGIWERFSRQSQSELVPDQMLGCMRVVKNDRLKTFATESRLAIEERMIGSDTGCTTARKDRC